MEKGWRVATFLSLSCSPVSSIQVLCARRRELLKRVRVCAAVAVAAICVLRMRVAAHILGDLLLFLYSPV